MVEVCFELGLEDRRQVTLGSDSDLGFGKLCRREEEIVVQREDCRGDCHGGMSRNRG